MAATTVDVRIFVEKIAPIESPLPNPPQGTTGGSTSGTGATGSTGTTGTNGNASN
jgi:hypothetical protein